MGLFLALILACVPALRADPAVKLGIDVLEEKNFAGLVGKRIGLITNPTGVDSRGISTIDVLRHAPGVKLVALFGPEHGVYGSDWAGAYVPSSIAAHTGLPVYSLYGPTRKPTPEMLKGIDVLMYDIQDIGCRSYTFISTLGLAMEAAGEAHIPFYVLDRPNPLNGNRVEGMRPAPGFRIVPMVGWYRSMYWDQTGLIWVPTSPHIPTADTSLDYVATGFLGEAGGINHGIGYTLPFKLVGHPSFNSFALAGEFNAMGLPGTLFRPATWEPFYGVFKNQVINGVQIYYTNRDQVDLCGLAAHILYTVYHKPGVKMFRTDASGDSGPEAFDKIAGGPALRLALQHGQTPEEIIGSWQPGLTAFREERRRFLLYGERPETAPPNSAAAPAPAAATTPPSHPSSPD
jgi:uncharacterized protein YbbC (DUF1343 family)